MQNELGAISRVIIAGGRDFDDYDLLCKKVDRIVENLPDIQIVSGGARGADKLGEQYAKDRGYPCKVFPADWDKYKKQAGFIRNKEMRYYATHVILFHDGVSKGTRHMHDIAKMLGLPTRVIKY